MEGNIPKERSMSMEVYTVPFPAENEKVKPVKTSFFHIDKEMIRFKVHFFLFIGAMGTVLPYVPVVARNRLELSATSLAAILTAGNFITVVSKPVIGYIADYFKKLKLMLNIMLIVQSICCFLILAIPPIKRPQQTSLSDHLKDWGQHSNFSIVDIKITKNCENVSPQSLIRAGGGFEGCEVDITCVGQLKESALFCFSENDVLENNTKLESKIEPDGKSLTCSVLSSRVTDRFETNTPKPFFQLNFPASTFSPQSSNETFLCSVQSFDENPSPDISDFTTLTFWIFALLMTISSICISSLFTLGDTACCESVQKYGRDFGRQRLFGAVGWGTLAPIGGLLCDLTNDYIAAWILMAVLQVLTLWNIYYMDLVEPQFSQNLLKDVGRVLKNKKFLAFDLGVFMNGMGAGIMWFYLVWFLAGLGASKFVCGLVQYVQCYVGEIPFMFFSGWFIRKVGHFNLVSLSLFSYAVRYLWYSYLQNPWLVLPVEIAHGFTYGTFYPTVASFGKLSAKAGTEATTQSILFTTHEGLGAGVGCVLAGIGFDYTGGHQTFFYISLFGFGACLLNIFNTILIGKHAKKEDTTPPAIR